MKIYRFTITATNLCRLGHESTCGESFGMTTMFKTLNNKPRGRARVLLMGPSLQQNGGMAEVQKLICEYLSQDLKVEHICTHDEGSIVHRLIVFGKAVGIFLKKLLTRETDLIHIHMSERGSVLRTLFLVLCTFIFRYPVLIHTHGAEFAPFFTKLPKWMQNLISYIFRRCSGFIVLSQSWNEFYRYQMKLRDDRIFTLPNSVELPAYVPKRDRTQVTKLVFCGRVGERKGAFDLIQALSLLPDPLKDATELVLAGDGDLEQAQRLISALGLSNTVQLQGWVDPVQRDQLLEDADIFILPSYNEGLPLAILEAMAWELPIISTPVGGIPEVVIHGQNGLLVEPGNVEELSQSIQSLIQDDKLRQSMGKHAREIAKFFDANSYSLKLAKIYNRVLQDSKVS